ncbi:MAG TPA: hypothetical protein DDY28_13195, partial [Hyphomonas atlantica]|nr:hypothetical protein [Hyphomonas atlantica]
MGVIMFNKLNQNSRDKKAHFKRQFFLGAASAPIAVVLATGSMQAFAQEGVERVEAEAEASKVEQTIIVTGSRIKNANLVSPSPVTT